MNDWQPIETAPKNGDTVLLWREIGGVVSAFWDCCADFDWWYIDDGKYGPYPLRGPNPTHWMPVPSGPNSKQ